MPTDSCCILNGGGGAWAFKGLARQLRGDLWLDVSPTPRAFNYLLHVDEPAALPEASLFIPLEAIFLTGDKRLLAAAFARRPVPTPQTFLIESAAEVLRLLAEHPTREWCLKFPPGCGASRHMLPSPGTRLPESWPRPFVVQKFMRLERPEVFRPSAAGGELFGWVARRFPKGAAVSPWVAHARGARYEPAGEAPPEAAAAARAALDAVGLLDSFGCADLIRRPSGQWLVLEVGTDGLVNHLDRDLGLPEMELELRRRVAGAFWRRLGGPPWGPGGWSPRSPGAVG
jgi:hypothetical protein